MNNKRVIHLMVLMLCGLLFGGTALADMNFKRGAVMARALVLNEQGQPILVEYNEDGTEAGEVSVPAQYANDINSLQIIAASEYLSHKERLEQYLQLHANDLARGAELKERTPFLAGSYLAADNTTTIPVPTLSENVKSVLVRGQADRIGADSNQLVLLSFPVNLVQNFDATGLKSLVVNDEGIVVASSARHIAYRVGFFGDDQQSENYSRRSDDNIFGPVANVKVFNNWPGGLTYTGNDGRYSMQYYLPPCPVGGFDFTTDVWAELQYKNFLPIGSPTIPYFLRKQEWTFCSAYLQLGPLGVFVGYVSGGSSINYLPSDLYVDVMFLTGQVGMENLNGSPVTVGGDTEYDAFESEEEQVNSINYYDFNGDGVADTVVMGKIKTLTDANGDAYEAFVAEGAAGWEAGDEVELQGVYFEAASVGTALPDLVRVPDTKKRIGDPVGQLKSISADDYKNTDILIFRESTGQLVTERRGIRDEEINGRVQTAYDDEANKFAYRIMIRGPKDRDLNIGGGNRSGGYEQFAIDQKMTAPFQQREADHLKPGEYVKIVAINRATGYIGTARVKLTSTNQNEASMLNVPIPEITMRPPNLKIWAERDYEVAHGITQGEDRHYVIGSEGAALTSDTTITIFTEWLDHDGSALPAELGLDNGEQYGYTGRLAKIVADNTLAGASVGGSNLAEFPIAPGRKIQAINVGSNLTQAEHYYIHVSGIQKDETPSFATGPSAPPYDSRPALLTPFYVPLFDEQTHWQTYNAYRDLKRTYEEDSQTNPNAIEPNKPLPAYAWQYRPEYQFSQYQLEMQSLLRVRDYNNSAEERTQEILELESPWIVSTDDVVLAIYSLISNDFDRLTPIDGEQQLILALGEEETLVTVGEDKTIVFENIDHLSSLDVEDYLSMRLYTNNDAGNILWEYAFEYLDFYALIDDDEIPNQEGALEVSADTPEVGLIAHVVGFASRDEESKYEVRVAWSHDSMGASLAEYQQADDEYAIFENKLTVSQVAGHTVKVTAEITNQSNQQTEMIPLRFVTVPGKPAQISTQQNGVMATNNVGYIEVTGTARDAWGNKVADGTSVTLSTDGPILIDTKPEATSNGEFSFRVRGTDYVGEASVKVRVGDVEEELSFDVQPLDVHFVSLPTSLQVNAQAQLSVSLSSGGQPVANTTLNLWAEGARVSPQLVETNSQGIATATLYAPENPRNIDLKAMVVMQAPIEHTIAILPVPNGSGISTNTTRTKMIGDIVQDEVFSYQRWDGNNYNIGKSVHGEIQLSGSAGSLVNVSLGDIFQPNRHTQAAYWMNGLEKDIVKDEVGQSDGIAENVVVSENTRNNAGNSFSFTQKRDANQNIVEYSRVKVADATHTRLKNNVSLTLDVNAKAYGGQILNAGNAIQLSLENDGSLLLTASFSGGGQATLSYPNFPLNQWQRVAVSLENSTLALAVEGSVSTSTVAQDLEYTTVELFDTVDGNGQPVANYYHLVLGQGFDGNLDNLKWFNLASDPLIVFENQLPLLQETASVVFDGSGQAIVPVQSLGHMHGFGSKLPMQSVAISVEGQTFIATLMSESAFEDMARAAVSAGLVAGTEAYNQSYLNDYSASLPSQSKGYSNGDVLGLFPNAYAYEISFWDIANIVGSLVGLDSLEVIWEQLGNMLHGRDVDVVSLSLAILDVLTLFPPAAPLKLVTGPAKLAVKLLKLGNNKAVKFLAGTFKKIFERAVKGDFDLVFQGMSFMIVVADIAFDEEARDGLVQLARAINSTDDFMTIMEFFSLGDEEIDLGVAGVDSEKFRVFPYAHASISGAIKVRIKKIVKEMGQEIGDSEFATKAMREVIDALKSMNRAQARRWVRHVYSKEMMRSILAVSKRVGVQNVRHLITGYGGQRVPPLALITAIAYLEWEIAENRLFPEDSDRQEENLNQLRLLYAKATPTLSGTQNGGALVAQAHGAVHHITYLALMHANSQATSEALAAAGYEGVTVGNVIGIEVPRVVPIYPSKRLLQSLGRKGSVKYLRYVDIMTGDLHTGEKWWELKSYRAKSLADRSPKTPIRKFDWQTGKRFDVDPVDKEAQVLRQFTLDRIAMRNGMKVLTTLKDAQALGLSTEQAETPWIKVDDMYWAFQKFRAGTGNNIVNPSLEKLRSSTEGLMQKPTNADALYREHVGGSVGVANRIKLGAVSVLLTNLKENSSELAEYALQEVIEE